ncbi:hypothetical protein HDZ31DRAFT_24896, partial [Schizophyllum fasciatum]
MSYPANIGPAPWQYTPYQGNGYQVPSYAQPQNNPSPFIPRAYPPRASAGAANTPAPAANAYYAYGQGQATPNYGHHVPIQDSLNPPDL